MTDTATQGISVTPEALQSKYDEIAAIDEQLDAASGSATQGKRATANSLASQHEATWKGLADGVIERLNTAKEQGSEVLVAAFSGLTKAIDAAFAKEVDEFLTAETEKVQTDAPSVSDEEIDSLTKQGREFREQYNALRSILEMFGQNVENVPVPKRLTGSRGKRGPRVLSKFDYSVDGQPRTKSQNSLSSIANTVCSDLNWKTKDLRAFIVESGIDINNPAETWEVTLPAPNGKVISAVKNSEEDLYEGSEDDEDDVVEDDES